MRPILFLIALGCAVAGIVWFFQGIGVIPGSFMTNDLTWSWIGGAMIVVAVGIFIFLRKR